MANDPVVPLEQALVGILALLAAARDDRVTSDPGPTNSRRTELILSDVGLTTSQIAVVVGKKPNTVSKLLSRARQRAAAVENEANSD